jgi:hypothetical protein
MVLGESFAFTAAVTGVFSKPSERPFWMAVASAIAQIYTIENRFLSVHALQQGTHVLVCESTTRSVPNRNHTCAPKFSMMYNSN